MRLYNDLADWYRLVDPPADHAEDTAIYRQHFDHTTPGARPLMELGSGGGHNAVHMKAHYECTLVDLSPEMLAISRDLNPECEHHQGDMRTVRLCRMFDVVLVHDAVGYMTTRDD